MAESNVVDEIAADSSAHLLEDEPPPYAAPEVSLAESGEPCAVPALPSIPARLTLWQRLMRGLIGAASIAVCAVLLAPVALAALVALGALVIDGLAALSIALLIWGGSIMQAGDAMGVLSDASRIGFLAVGYLGLFFALIPLLAGLLGRGRGRLFIIPGALLTTSALVLCSAGVALCWPLLALLAAPRAALVAVALFLALDTIALATLLADTRYTRRHRPGARRGQRSAAPQPEREAPLSPSSRPPTLAGV